MSSVGEATKGRKRTYPQGRRRKASGWTGWYLYAVPLVAGTILLLMYGYHMGWTPMRDDPVRWGVFGDFVGGILNPLLAYGTLVAVLVTLQHQRNVDRITRIEEHIFQLLELNRACAADIEWGNKKGAAAFRLVVERVVGTFIAGCQANNECEPEHLARAYHYVYEKDRTKDAVGHYFRQLYHIFKYIRDTAPLSDEERLRYAKLVRAQMSLNESALLLLNGLHPLGKNFCEYIDEYSLLQDVTAADFGRREISDAFVSKLYAPCAFHDDKPKQVSLDLPSRMKIKEVQDSWNSAE